MKKISYGFLVLCMLLSILPFSAAAQAEWVLEQNVPFTADTSSLVNITNPDPDAVTQAYTADGLLLTRKAEGTVVGLSIPLNGQGSGKKIDSGRYYLELNYLSNYTKGETWSSFKQGNSEGITFNLQPNNIGVALATAAGANGWLGGGALPTHVNGTEEKLGFIVDTGDRSVIICQNRSPVTETKYYFRYSSVNSIDTLYMEFKNQNLGGTLLLKGLKAWKYTEAAPEEALFRADVDSVTYASLSAEGQNSITQDLRLPATLTNGTKVTWKSNNEAVISDSGAVSRPISDAAVTLTASFTSANGAYTDTKDFHFTVLKAAEWSQLFNLDYQTADYRVDQANSNLSVTRGADGLTITGLKDANIADATTALKMTLPFTKALQEQKEYYLEIAYQDAVANNAQLYAAVQGKSASGSYSTMSAFTWDNAATVGAKGRTSPSAGDAWLDAKQCPPNAKNTDQTMGYHINNKEHTFNLYGNRAKTTTQDYTYSYSAIEVSQIILEVKRNIKKDDYFNIKRITVWEKMDSEKLNQFQEDVDSLDYARLTSEDKDQITRNLDLPGTLPNGTTVAWQTSDADVITTEGVVTPSASEDKRVRLTARLTMKDSTYSVTKTFDFTVPQKQMSEEEKFWADVNAVTYSKLTGEDPDILTANLSLPSAGNYGTQIGWESSNPDVISKTGVVTRSGEDLPAVLTATFTKGSFHTTKDFSFYVARSDWQLCNEIIFDKASGQGYTISAASENYSVEEVDQGVKITKLNDEQTTATAALTFSTPMNDGQYYIEFDYNMSILGTGTNRKLWATLMDGGTEAVTFVVEQGSSVSLALRKNGTDTATGGWLGAPLPPHTNKADEKLGFEIKTADQSVQAAYTNRVKSGMPVSYLRSPGAKKITAFRLEMQNGLKTGDSLTLHNIRAWQKAGGQGQAEDLTYEMLTGENPGMITKSLNLPTQLEGGSRVAWTSTDDTVMKPDGTILRGSEDKEVTLQASIVLGTVKTVKTFRFVVLAEGKEDNHLFLDASNFGSGAEGWNNSGNVAVQNEMLVLTQTASQAATAERNFVLDDGGFRATGDKVILETDLRVAAGEAVQTVYAADGTVAAEYKTGQNAKVRMVFNTTAKTYSVYENGTAVVENAAMQTADIGKVRFGLSAGAGKLTLASMRLMVETQNKAQTVARLDAANIRFSDISSNEMDAVVKDLSLMNTGILGSTLHWTSSNTAVVSATGKVERQEEDVQVDITVTAEYSGQTAQNSFRITVRGKHGNLAAGKKVMATGSATAEYVKENAVDSFPNTAWRTSDGSAKPSITIDFGTAKEKISKVILYEATDTGSGLVTSFVVEASDTNSSKEADWTQLAAGTSVGSGAAIVFVPDNTRYLRYRVVSKEAGNTGLYEFEAYFEPTDQNAVKADKEALTDGGQYEITGDLTLPLVGAFSSDITWTSSQPDYFSSGGKLLGRPSKSLPLTLTAKISKGSYSEEKSFTHYIAGSGGGSPSGGGGGSSVSGGGNVTIVTGSPSPTPDATPTPTPVPTPGQDTRYTDVPKESWSYEYIEELSEANILSGDGSGNFRPQDSVSREEFLKMLIVALDIPLTGDAADFTDVEAGSWYAPYVATAAKLGLSNGISAEVFGVGQSISRQDMAAMVVRAAQLAGVTIGGGEQVSFTDAAEIDAYAADAVNQLAAAGLISGADGKFQPKSSLTREQAAKIICLTRRAQNEAN